MKDSVTKQAFGWRSQERWTIERNWRLKIGGGTGQTVLMSVCLDFSRLAITRHRFERKEIRDARMLWVCPRVQGLKLLSNTDQCCSSGKEKEGESMLVLTFWGSMRCISPEPWKSARAYRFVS
jgi:hypothetical protein